MTDWAGAGLNVQSAVKRGLFTIEERLVIKRIGSLAAADRGQTSWAGNVSWQQRKRREASQRQNSQRQQVAAQRAHRGRQVAGRIPDIAIGAQYRRLQRRRGKKKAVVAVGRHILDLTFHLLSTGRTYHELGPDYFVRARADAVRRRSVRMLERLGDQVTLTPLPTAA